MVPTGCFSYGKAAFCISETNFPYSPTILPDGFASLMRGFFCTGPIRL